MISNERNDVAECQESGGIVAKSLSTSVCKYVNVVRICRAGDHCKNSDVFFESQRSNRMMVTKLCSLKGGDCQQREMENNSFTVVPLLVTIMIFFYWFNFVQQSKWANSSFFIASYFVSYDSVFWDDPHMRFSGLCIISKMCCLCV